MTETTKTFIFLGVAAGSLVAAAATSRSTSDFDIHTRVGEYIAQFEPADAKQLKIVEFNEDTATLSEFEVAQDDAGVWSLTSKNGYPADAEQQMGEAAGSLLDRQILAVQSESAANHEEYGVVDPTSPKLEVGQKGVGRRVTVSDINDEPLIDLIIGKEVKDATDQRYVREANRDFVYVIEIDPTKLSTNFEDWIEEDLLNLNPWDIKQVSINDYSIQFVRVDLFNIRPEWHRRGQFTLRYDDSDAKWVPVSLQTFDETSGEYVDAMLAENQELDKQKLNDLKRALDDLRIVDVERKPSGLSANLKAGEDFLKDQEAINSLFDRGFNVFSNQEKDLELLSSEGEIVCTMKNGAEYVLRFGDLQATADKQKSSGEEEKADGGGVNRYLFVMVRMNEDAVERPELEELPELPAEPASAGGEAGEDGEDGEDSTATTEDAEAETGADAASETQPESETETGDDTPSTNADSAEEDATGDDALEKVIEERKKIEAANQRKLDDYQKKLKEGREKVDELNTRFGDWYYVISNDVFKKIHLSHDDLVTEKEASDKDKAAAGETSEFGAPGAAVPGVPDVPAGGDEDSE